MKYNVILCLLLLGACNTPRGENAVTDDQPAALSVSRALAVSPEGCEAPNLFTSPDGQVYLTWTRRDSLQAYLEFITRKEDGNWTDPVVISEGNDWFVNWADYPSFSTGNEKDLLTNMLVKSSSGAYSYDIKLIRSEDSGQSWQEPFLLNSDGKNAEHGFVSMVPYENNTFISWLDGRNTESGGPMTLRAAVISPKGEKLKEWELDDRVCDCCQTSALITPEGPAVIYRDRSANEIRDMSIVRFVQDEWSEPTRIHADNWEIKGCPVNGPRAVAYGKVMVVAWFTGAGGKGIVNIAFSTDAGRTFTTPVKLNSEGTIGRVDVVLLDTTRAMVSFMEESTIRAVIVESSGEILERFDLGSTSASRSSGFPQLTRSGNEIICAWTDPDDSRIHSRIVSID